MSDEKPASDRLRARLTGAIALLIIGTAAWFWLLDADSPVQTVVQESAIPPAPDIKPFTVPEPQAPANIKPVGSEQDAPVVDEAITSPAAAAPMVREEPAAASAPASKPVPKLQAEKTPGMKPVPPAKATSEKFQMDSNNLPVAWVVQVGAMSTQASADKLKAQLLAKGFKAYTQPAQMPNGTTAIKVFVGPKLSRERADAQKKAIDAALKTNTMVVRFPAS